MLQTIPALQIVHVKRTGSPERQKRIEQVWVKMPEGKLKVLSVATAVSWVEALVCRFFVFKDGESIPERIRREPCAEAYLEAFRGTEGTDGLHDLGECPS